MSFGKSLLFIFFGILFTVLRFSVIISPSIPFPRDTPKAKELFLYVNDAEIPSIFGSTLYSILFFKLFVFKKLEIFFSKFIRSSSLKALDKDNIFVLCIDFKKFFEGLYPIVVEGDHLLFKKLYFFSKSKISFFKISNFSSEILGLFFS